MNIHRFIIKKYLHIYLQMKDNCLHFNLVPRLLIYLEDWLRYVYFTTHTSIYEV